MASRITKVVRVTQPIYSDGGILLLPEWCLEGLVNTHIPSEAELFTESTTKRYPLGTKLTKPDGTIWRYSRNGEDNSATYPYCMGSYTQIPGKAGNSVGSGFEGGITGSIAAGQVWMDIADTAATQDLYEGALLVLYDTTSGYQQYRVVGNDVYDTHASGITRLYIGEPGFKAVDTGSPGVTIYLSPYYDIRTTQGRSYMSVLGAARQIMSTGGEFFWMQTAGLISGLTGAGTWPGQTAYYRDVYHHNGTVGTYSAGYQLIGHLAFRTASDYGDNTFIMTLDS